MRKFLIALTLATTPLAFAAPVFAADERPAQRPHHERRQPTAEEKAKHEARRKEWEAMTPAQRQAKMKEMREKREASMTPEQRAKREARKKEWEAMTPEQREAKMKEMKERRGDRPHRQRPQP
jgi:Spy/CpxP family protein refolding chaperone